MKGIIKRKFFVLSVTIALLAGFFAPVQMVHAAGGDTIVYITKTGECYHADGCGSLSRSKIETTLQNAVKRGYRPCSKCHPVTLDATGTDTTASNTTSATGSVTTVTTVTNVVTDAVEALKTYKGNTAEFNAYTYYINNVDLQTAIGADGDKLLKHYNDFGKAEGRIAK